MGRTRVLVTGGAGYVGSHTAKALAEGGYQPVVLDDLSEGNRWAVKWGPLVEGDIADEELVRLVIQQYGIEAVCHLAASAYVGESMRNPRKYFHNNVTKSLGLLDTLLDCGVTRLIFASSCAIYGLPQTALIGESHPQIPVNPYGETKLLFERACHWYEKAHQLRSVCLRFFNAAGADPDGEIGESHSPETHLVPLVIAAAQGSGASAEVTIHGTDFPTPDGTAIRDYVHVSDIARAHVRALDYLMDGGENVSLNLGTGTGTSVLEVVHAVERVTGLSVAARMGPRRDGDPPVLMACADRATSVLGWKPEFQDVESIVSTAWAWNQAHVFSDLATTF